MTCDDCGPMAADLRRTTDAWRFWEADARRWRRQASDIRLHLRDRDAHIANLEAQLRPFISAATDGDQEALV